MNELDAASAGWLVSSEGLEVVAAATRALDDGADALTVGELLRDKGHEHARAVATLDAALARRRARELWSDADRLVFTREALEQASHPLVAGRRAQRYRNRSVWDLCAGVGGDAMALAQDAVEFVAVEHDPARAVLLRHNLDVRELDAQVVTGDALEVTVGDDSVVHVDPARRVGGRRVRRLRDHVPPVGSVVAAHRRCAGLGIALSPAVDAGDPDLPSAELEFVQVGDRLVEAVAWTGVLRRERATATATLLPRGTSRSRSGAERPSRLPVGPVGTHLVEVVPAAVRARLHDDIGREIGAHRIARRRALLTTDDSPPSSAWYRSRAVETVLPVRSKQIRRWLQGTDPGPVEIVLHGVDGDVERWWRELGRPPRGPNGVRLELVRLDRGASCIVTRSSAA